MNVAATVERKQTHIELLYQRLTNQNEELSGCLARLSTVCIRFQNVPSDQNKKSEEKAQFGEGALNAMDNAIVHNRNLIDGIRDCIYKLEEII